MRPRRYYANRYPLWLVNRKLASFTRIPAGPNSRDGHVYAAHNVNGLPPAVLWHRQHELAGRMKNFGIG